MDIPQIAELIEIIGIGGACLGTAVASIFAAFQSHFNGKTGQRNESAIREVQVKLNGRLGELIDLAREAAFKAGVESARALAADNKQANRQSAIDHNSHATEANTASIDANTAQVAAVVNIDSIRPFAR